RRHRHQVDASCRPVVVAYLASAVFWLLMGNLLAMLASIKMHSPYFLGEVAWLTFGRVRPAHLNTMIYGWASLGGVGVALWLQARLARTLLPYRVPLLLSCFYWNAAVLWGSWQILAGHSTGIEWLEFPPLAALAPVATFVVLVMAAIKMIRDRRESHLYVSQWYLFASVLWFPLVYLAAIVFMFALPAHGMVQGVGNWWFAHNVLGLWFTPIGVATVYYLIPKVLGRPIHSYYLSILGFWTLALFYNWAGTHHLIGGPLPAWLVTVGIVGSLMMFVPVVTVALNHHLTMVGYFHRLRDSMALRFTVFGAMAYTLVSLQGSLTALRSVNLTTHFTHYTIAHAHLGVYAFYTMVLFGAFYFILPELLGRPWSSPTLMRLHFWCTSLGITVYFVALTIGGVLQGIAMNQAETPLLEIARRLQPYLQWRTAAGALLSVGHLAFAMLVLRMLRPGPV
ncbi:MAG: hypothetical protein EOO40_07775, partial [Deltaproteobacteria bacterium]